MKQTHFAFSFIKDVSLVLPNRENGNLNHSHNTAALNTSPPPLTDLRVIMDISFKKIRI